MTAIVSRFRMYNNLCRRYDDIIFQPNKSKRITGQHFGQNKEIIVYRQQFIDNGSAISQCTNYI